MQNLDQVALLSLIRDLYNADKNNQNFLHARFLSDGNALEPYKKQIVRWICPDVMRDQPMSITKAKKAITDYKKAIGRPQGLAELMVFYCESCADFLDYCGMDDFSFFDAWVNMFEQALKVIVTLDPNTQAPLVKRLIDLINRKNQSWDPEAASEMMCLLVKYGFGDTD